MKEIMNPKQTLTSIRDDFPILSIQINEKPLIYLDNAATIQKPLSVLKSIEDYYFQSNANVHRGAHFLSQKATQLFEDAREKVQYFIHAKYREEIVWSKGTTESINLVAQSWGRTHICFGDEIILSTLGHHSNIVPWQLLCQEKGAIIKVIQLKNNGELDYEHYCSLLNKKTKLVALEHASNALGTINPIKKMIEAAHKLNALVLIDGAQSIAHFSVDVQSLDCDFYAFSGHKMFATMGTGVLYGKKAHLDTMPPWQGGGEMIKKVSFEKTTFNELPYKFEAGTPNVSGAIAIASAINYIQRFNEKSILHYETALLHYATKSLKKISGVFIYAEKVHKVPVISFTIKGCHSHDVGMILDELGIAVRTGHHCAMPLMEHLNIEGTIRVSLCMYNTEKEIDALCNGLKQALSMLL
jgi:cysteine desulfurase/selenocysteine lyase